MHLITRPKRVDGSHKGGVWLVVAMLVVYFFAPLEDRLRSVTSRLEKLSELFEQSRSILVPHLESQSASQRQDLERAVDMARKEVEKHRQWIETQLISNAAGDYRLGAVIYDQKLAQTLQSPLTRKQIKVRGEQKLRTLHDPMFEISKDIYQERFPYT